MNRTERRRDLLLWYDANRRDLPWRRTADPYAVWISEIMLQQTRVDTVVDYYRRFIERFPDVATLAAAGEEEVLALWSGLGYYRRARGLHRAARKVMAEHDGELPRDPRSLRTLPGVGRYTAGAVASIAFGLCEPILDGNVRRVLSRWLGLTGEAETPAAVDRRLWVEAADLVEGPRPGDLNQALMELGATVCTPREPGCRRCPVVSGCAAATSGDPSAYPAPRRRAATQRVRAAVAVVCRGARVLLERPGADSPLPGTWDLPACALKPGESAAEALVRTLARRHDLEIGVEAAAARASHGIMNRRLELAIHAARVRRGRIAGKPGLRWVERSDLGAVAISGATLKALRGLQGRLIR